MKTCPQGHVSLFRPCPRCLGEFRKKYGMGVEAFKEKLRRAKAWLTLDVSHG